MDISNIPKGAIIKVNFKPVNLNLSWNTGTVIDKEDSPNGVIFTILYKNGRYVRDYLNLPWKYLDASPSSQSVAVVSNTLLSFLEEINLKGYFDTFVEMGFEDIEYLKELSNEQIGECLNLMNITKPGHRSKIICKLKCCSIAEAIKL